MNGSNPMALGFDPDWFVRSERAQFVMDKTLKLLLVRLGSLGQCAEYRASMLRDPFKVQTLVPKVSSFCRSAVLPAPVGPARM